jgi:hypothetical protein
MRAGGASIVIVAVRSPQAVQPDQNNYHHREGSADDERNGFKGTVHVAPLFATGGRPLPADWGKTSGLCITLAD